MVFYRSLSNSKSPLVSRTLLSILADPNNAIVWIVSTCPLIYTSSTPLTNLLVTVQRPPITIGITDNFMLYSFFQFSSKVYVFSSLFVFFQFYPLINRNGKVHNSAGSLFLFIYSFLLTITRSDRLAEIWWSI